MKRRILRFIAAGLVVIAACNTGLATPRCEEDMPCWNCHTMGNHICGPGAS